MTTIQPFSARGFSHVPPPTFHSSATGKGLICDEVSFGRKKVQEAKRGSGEDIDLALGPAVYSGGRVRNVLGRAKGLDLEHLRIRGYVHVYPDTKPMAYSIRSSTIQKDVTNSGEVPLTLRNTLVNGDVSGNVALMEKTVIIGIYRPFEAHPVIEDSVMVNGVQVLPVARYEGDKPQERMREGGHNEAIKMSSWRGEDGKFRTMVITTDDSARYVNGRKVRGPKNAPPLYIDRPNAPHVEGPGWPVQTLTIKKGGKVNGNIEFLGANGRVIFEDEADVPDNLKVIGGVIERNNRVS